MGPVGGNGDGCRRETKLLILVVVVKVDGAGRVVMVVGAIAAEAEPKIPSRTANVDTNFIVS